MAGKAWWQKHGGAVCQIVATVLKQRKMPVAVQLAFSFLFSLGTQPLGRGRPLSGADLPMIGVFPKWLQIQLLIKINPQSSGKTLALRNKQTPFKNSVSERMCTSSSSLDLWTPSLQVSIWFSIHLVAGYVSLICSYETNGSQTQQLKTINPHSVMHELPSYCEVSLAWTFAYG